MVLKVDYQTQILMKRLLTLARLKGQKLKEAYVMIEETKNVLKALSHLQLTHPSSKISMSSLTDVKTSTPDFYKVD